MEFYKDEKGLEKKIIEPGQHFIYGKTCDCRAEFLKGIEEKHPIESGNNPAVIYLDQFGFKGDEPKLSDRDKKAIPAISARYLEFCIIARILERTPNNCDLSELINVDHYLWNKGVKFKTIEELLKAVIASREIYKQNYHELINGNTINIPAAGIAITRINLDRFVEEYRKAIGMPKHFTLILDHTNPIITSSVKVVNDLMFRSTSDNLSVNVATDPDKWQTFYKTQEGNNPIQTMHDFTVIQLDDSYQKSIGAFKRKIGL